jgi:hypothetical protein
MHDGSYWSGPAIEYVESVNFNRTNVRFCHHDCGGYAAGHRLQRHTVEGDD